ncbi:anti-sigma factor [Leifsonia sp. AG29]|uniref:anti-sigma factor n=1 Tax=Leifsonia sp. AG29 TaxID=2598860 RepID=UPI00131AF3D9|nr:anti-sigma factor [Leifsonia sp. AG29]
MSHSDPDVIAMLALGETDVSEADVDHVMTCPACRSELDRLTRVTRAVRENGEFELELVDPPTRVWDRIREEVEAGAVAPAPVVSLSDRVPAQRPRRPRRRLPRFTMLIAAAAVVLIAAGAALVLVLRPGATVEAHAALAGLPAWSSSNGSATMEREPDGTTVLDVQLASPATASGSGHFREVWLMNRELTKSISVGLLDGSEGRFVMPPNISAADYPVVDVSQQPLDGNPAHSGDSIVRGTLAPRG